MGDFNVGQYTVSLVPRSDTARFVLEIHYAKRWLSISWAFGLFKEGRMVGVCTYGTPSSAPLKRGIAGDEYKGDVIELNRLCLESNLRNEASYLVAKSLSMLPKNKIVVSFADTEQGHVGTVYQAANFIYCGLSAKRTDWKVRGMEHLHGQTVADEFRGVKNRAAAMRAKYGEDFYLSPRSRKHRYVFVVGSKTYKKNVIRALKYTVLPYPKVLTTLSAGGSIGTSTTNNWSRS